MKAKQILRPTDLTIDRPEPITETIPVLGYYKEIDPKQAVNELLEGNHVLIADQFSSGLLVLNTLKERLFKNQPKQTFENQRNLRDAYRKASQLLLIEISNHRLQVKKAPEIGWLKKLYVETPDFLLPFTDIQGLNSSWQWYEKGIRIPGLKQTLHPFYGTYFPTRFEHIDLFVNYLKKYRGPKENAFDVGIGSGILSKLFHQFGFKEVHASDINPNALIGILVQNENEKEESADFLTGSDRKNVSLSVSKEKPQTNLYFGDLFADSKIKSDVIVFNPPWIPLPKEVSGIDLAIYYDPKLFPRFFEEAYKHLNPEGNVVLLFSNLAGLMDPKFVHPIELELKSKKRFSLVEKTVKKVAAASTKTKRKTTWRDEEFVECWILKLKM